MIFYTTKADTAYIVFTNNQTTFLELLSIAYIVSCSVDLKPGPKLLKPTGMIMPVDGNLKQPFSRIATAPLKNA